MKYSMGAPISTGASEVNSTPPELTFCVSPSPLTRRLPALTSSTGSFSSYLLDFLCSFTATLNLRRLQYGGQAFIKFSHDN